MLALLVLHAAVAAQEGFYREFWNGEMPKGRFRVNSPEVVLHPQFGKRFETKSSGMLEVNFPQSLFELDRAELYLELWGGHPHTANKRVTINGRSTLRIPETGTAEGHCTHLYPTLEVALTDLVEGRNALQFACDKGKSFWGHFIVEKAALRGRLKDGWRGCTYALKVKQAGEDVQFELGGEQRCLDQVARFDVEPFYAGYAENGALEQPAWHTRFNMAGLEAQGGIRFRAMVRMKDEPSLVYRTAETAPISTPRREHLISRVKAESLPVPFWSRANRKQSVAFIVDSRPEEILAARLRMTLWDGGVEKITRPFSLNGLPLEISSLGKHDVVQVDLPLAAGLVKRGENVLELVSDTEHHGIEVLLPGPELLLKTKPRVAVKEVEHQGQLSYRIETASADYVFHREGGGLASMIDPEGKDWISYRPGGRAGGEFRGIPNLGEVFHPGYTGERGAKTELLEGGPDRAVLSVTSNNARWRGRWEFYPDRAEFTVLEAGGPYWFLYEGTPAGRMNEAEGWWMASDGIRRPLESHYSGDLPDPEWVRFGDAASRRVLVLENHQPDQENDQYWPMDGLMTVFGFGREYRCCGRYLKVTPARFTVRLAPAMRR